MSSNKQKQSRNKRQNRASKRSHQPKRNNNNNHIVASTLRTPFPDQLVGTFNGTVEPTTLFATAVSSAGSPYRMTDMYNYLSATPMNFQFWNDIAGAYQRYRVLHSKATFRLSNRETTKTVYIVLAPSLSSAVSTAGLYDEIASLPGAKCITLNPLGSGGSSRTVSLSMVPRKLVGEQYNTQDEYSGSIATGSSPTTPLYWALYAFCVGNFTVTTGGIVSAFSLTQKVLMYELDRDATFALHIKSHNLQSIENGIKRLKEARNQIELSPKM